MTLRGESLEISCTPCRPTLTPWKFNEKKGLFDWFKICHVILRKIQTSVCLSFASGC